jgi:xanthine dehydrogenase YagS FAD-binding subunit
MKPFEYVTALSPESAAQLVGTTGRFLAGGIDILGEMKDALVEPARLVNIKQLSGTREIAAGGEAMSIGANVTIAEIAQDKRIEAAFPGLVQAAKDVGSPQIRNVATLGGNLAQHSRCWYYRHKDVRCLKEGGSTCYAREGENKFHSIFSGNPCVSPTPSNLAVALSVLDASVAVQRAGKVIPLTIAALYEAAWFNPLAHNSLQPGDLILRIDIPVRRSRSAYIQVSEKHDFDWALVSCSAAARVEGNKLIEPRVALGQIAPVPYRSDETDRFLEGKTLDDRVAGEAADLLLKGAQPLEHNGYKIPIAHALIRRTLLKLIG